MLSQERYGIILDTLYHQGNVTLQELMDKLSTSESTVRRDLQTLEDTGRLRRVHGGAILQENTIVNKEDSVSSKRRMHVEEKKRIGKKAASFIEPDDFIYIDAGTTTEAMCRWIDQKDAMYMTDSITHAKILADKGLKVFIPGGQFKAETEAIIGMVAVEFLEKYNFTKGFFGTNAISTDGKLTTPDINEAMIKKKAMAQCQKVFVVSDTSKFSRLNQVTFARVEDVTIVTNHPFDESLYKNGHFILA